MIDHWDKWEREMKPRWRPNWTNIAIWGSIVWGSIFFWYLVVKLVMNFV